MADTTDRGTQLDDRDATRIDAFSGSADRSSGVLHRVLRRRPEDICGELACTPSRVHLQLERRAVAVVADPELNDRTGRHRRGHRALVVDQDDALAWRLDAARPGVALAAGSAGRDRPAGRRGLTQRPTRGADIAARGGSTTARKFAIVPSRRAPAAR